MSKKSIAKIPQHTTKKKQVPRTESQWDEYLNTLSLKMEPAGDAFFKRIPIELITWAQENKSAYRLTQFLNMKGIPRGTWFKWCESKPLIKEAHEIALSLIADRREIGALERRLDSTMVKHTMPMYDKEWKALEEWRAKISNNEEQSGNKIVVIERFGEKE